MLQHGTVKMYERDIETQNGKDVWKGCWNIKLLRCMKGMFQNKIVKMYERDVATCNCNDVWKRVATWWKV